MEIIEYLWELQNLEENSRKIQEQMKSIPEYRELKELKTEIEAGQKEVHGLKQELETVKKSIRLEEDALAIIKDKIKKSSDELYGGQMTGAKELETAEKNIDKLNQQCGAAEDKILTIMETADNQENRIAKMTAALEERKNAFKNLNSRYKKTKEDLQNALAEITSRIEALKEKIPPDELEKYRKLCSRFKDSRAIAVLQGGICSGCNMGVSFDIRKKAKNDSNVKCDNCGRLLIIK